jgi:hypothetical protein
MGVPVQNLDMETTVRDHYLAKYWDTFAAYAVNAYAPLPWRQSII